MTIERYVTENGIVIDTEVMSDEFREIAVGRVTSKVPPLVKIPARHDPVPIHARIEGLTVEVDDLVAVFRVEQGIVAVGKVEVL